MHQVTYGESKRPITERTSNLREIERPIYHFLIEMVHEESRQVGASFWSPVANIY